MSGKQTVHILEITEGAENVKLSYIMQRVAPDIPVKSHPLKDMYSAPSLEDLGDTGDIKIIAFTSWSFIKLLRTRPACLPNLQWAHSITTGVDVLVDYFQETQTRPSYKLTRSLAMGSLVPEYAIGQILAHQRRFYKFHDQQKEKIWYRRTGKVRLMKNYTVVVLGMGNIGKRIAELCKVFGMTVHGVTRAPVALEQRSPNVDCYSTVAELDKVLGEGDYIVSVLPSTPDTRGLLDKDRLQACKEKKPVFINAGRGDLVTEESILKSLRSGWISDAVLDVFPVEPLPKDSPLWTEPGVTLTPHVAANLNEELCNMLVGEIIENYRRFESGRPLLNEVNIAKGY